MVCLVKNRTKFYKKTLLDVWGHHVRYFKVTKAINFIRTMRAENRARWLYYKKEIIYTFEKRKKFRYKKRFKNNYIQQRFVRNFFLVKYIK